MSEFEVYSKSDPVVYNKYFFVSVPNDLVLHYSMTTPVTVYNKYFSVSVPTDLVLHHTCYGVHKYLSLGC